MAGDRTEAPTQKRRDEAAKRGERAQSRELGPAMVMLAGAAYLALSGAALIDGCADTLRQGLALPPGAMDAFDPAQTAVRLGRAVAIPLGCLLVLCCAAAVFSGTLLGGGAFHAGQLAPKLSRLDPFAGFARMFGARGPTELGKSLLKVLVVGGIAFVAVRAMIGDLTPLTRVDPMAASAALGHRASRLFLALTVGLVVIAAVDAPLSWVRFTAKLRMTKQEVKDEAREQDGNPEVKAQQRRRMREAKRGTAAQAVASAHVVLTNPSHFAVALRYRRAEDSAPVLVAKGRGDVAAAIRAAAAEHALPCLEYPELARALYFTGKRGQTIDPELYAAVAAILAFVFSLSRPGAPPAAPAVEIPPSSRFDEHGRRLGL